MRWQCWRRPHTWCGVRLRIKRDNPSASRQVGLPGRGVLLIDSPQLDRRTSLLGQDSPGHRDDILLAILGILEERRAPCVPANGPPGNKDGRRGELAREVVEHVVALEGAVKDEARQLDNLLVRVSRLQVTDKEGVGARDGDLVLELLENYLLHVQDLNKVETS